MGSEMMMECVILNGKVINFGPWDYQTQPVQVGENIVSPAEYDEAGNLIKEEVAEPIFEDVVTNPLPDGVIIEQMEVLQTEDGGLKADSADPAVRLVASKESKLAELNSACNAAILAGFESSALGAPHFYDFDYEAQINLAGMLNAIANAMITGSISWKASGVPTDHTIDQFKQLYADGLAFKNAQIQRYWALKAQVNAAATIAEVEAVVW